MIEMLDQEPPSASSPDKKKRRFRDRFAKFRSPSPSKSRAAVAAPAAPVTTLPPPKYTPRPSVEEKRVSAVVAAVQAVPTASVSIPAAAPVTTSVAKPDPNISHPDWMRAQWKAGLAKAQEKLSDKEKVSLSALTASSDASFTDVLDKTTEVYDEAKAKQWTYTWRGKEVVVAEQFDRVSKTLETFAKIGDTFIQHSPEVSSLIWGSLRFMLTVSGNVACTTNALFEALETIIRTTFVCQYYASVFVDLGSRVKGIPGTEKGLNKMREEVLTDFYCEVLVFIVKAKRYWDNGTKERIVGALESFEANYGALIGEVKKREAKVKEHANMSGIQVQRDMSTRTMEMKSQLDNMETIWTPMLHDIQAEVSQVTQKLERAEMKENMEKCRKWLSYIDPMPEAYEKLRDRRMSGTCEWIYDIYEFEQWVRNLESHLWIHGEPGSGKSVMSASIVDRALQRKFPFNTKIESTVLYCFVTHKAQTTSNVLCSLIEQLFRSAHGRPNVVQKLRDVVYPVYEQIGISNIPCPENELWGLLRDMLEVYTGRHTSPEGKITDSSPVMIIIDGLDEGSNLESFLKLSESLKARTLITSRCTPQLQEAFDESTKIEYFTTNSNPALRSDIETFILNRISENRRLKRLGPKLESAIIAKVQGTADGMFRYANLMLDELSRPSNGRPVMDIVNSIPSGLNQMYVYLLQNLPEEWARLRCTTLMWLTHAVRPVTVEEIAYANEAVPTCEFDPQGVLLADKEDIKAACGSLVEFYDTHLWEYDKRGFHDRIPNVVAVRFTHLTAKEFFQSQPEILSGMMGKLNPMSDSSHLSSPEVWTHAYMAMTCFAQLSPAAFTVLAPPAPEEMVEEPKPKSIFSPPRVRQEMPKVPLLYAVAYAFEHAKQVSQHGRLPKTIISVIKDILFTEMRFSTWKQWYPVLGSSSSSKIPCDLLFQSGPFPNLDNILPIHVVIANDLVELIPDVAIASDSATLSFYFKQDSVTALDIAGVCGSVRALDWFIHKKLVDREQLGTALLWATRFSQQSVVDRCLKEDVCLSRVDGRKKSALFWAIDQGCTSIAKAILQHPSIDELDFGAGDFSGLTPLHIAARKNNQPIIELLLKFTKVDIEATDMDGNNPLDSAAQFGHKEAFKFLLSKGVQCTSGSHLITTARGGHEEITKLLVKSNIDVDYVDKHKRTALSYAAEHGHINIVKLLLDAGAHVGGADENGLGVLNYALGQAWSIVSNYTVGPSHETVLKLILETEKAEVNHIHPSGRSVLSYAAEFGSSVSVQMLLDYGASTDLVDRHGRTALSYASAKHHKTKTVKTLLDHGAGTRDPDKTGRTSLSYAAELGRSDSVKMLLEMGAEPRSTDKDGRSPLSWAAGNGKTTNAKTLLAYGADTRRANNQGRTPLSYAAERGKSTTVQILLENDADARIADKESRTPLFYAMKEGQESVIELL